MRLEFEVIKSNKKLYSLTRWCTTSSPSSITNLKQIHCKLIRTGGILDILSAGKLISDIAISNPSNLSYARSVFSRLGYRPNTFTWNSMIRGYAHSPDPEEAIFLFRQMLKGGILPNNYTFPFLFKACTQLVNHNLGFGLHGTIIKLGFEGCDAFIQTSLISFYASCGYIDIASHLFNQSIERDVTSWNALIKGYVKSNRFMDAIRVFRMMLGRKDIRADEITLLGVILACTQLGALDMGRWIHAYIDKSCLELSTRIGTALMDMYARCGSIDVAKTLFDKMHDKDVRSWSVMIGGFAIHGYAYDALELFNEMNRLGFVPDSVTFTAVLSACSHSGMVEEALQVLNKMREDYGLVPTIEHYGCIVDLFCRARRLNEALCLIKELPMRPDLVLWGSLLVACRANKNMEIGEMVAKEILKLDPHHCGAHVFLSNVYASFGRWAQVEQVRSSMNDKGIRKQPGSSVIELGGDVHEFTAGDRSHPQSKEIQVMLDEIVRLLSLEGHMPSTREIPLDIDEEEKEQALYQHSEKLAVAFGLINTEKGVVLRIVKNLRICDDCHSTMKLISKVFDRTIIIRDRNRFHHFKGGLCSCNDFW